MALSLRQKQMGMFSPLQIHVALIHWQPLVSWLCVCVCVAPLCDRKLHRVPVAILWIGYADVMKDDEILVKLRIICLQSMFLYVSLGLKGFGTHWLVISASPAGLLSRSPSLALRLHWASQFLSAILTCLGKTAMAFNSATFSLSLYCKYLYTEFSSQGSMNVQSRWKYKQI